MKAATLPKKVARFFKKVLATLRPSCLGEPNSAPKRTESGRIIVTRVASCSLPDMRGITLEAALEELSKQETPSGLDVANPTKGGINDAKADGEHIAALVAARIRRIHEKWSPERRKLIEQRSIEERYAVQDTFSRAFGQAFYRKAVENYQGGEQESSGLIPAGVFSS